jgi:hypothetical protein
LGAEEIYSEVPAAMLGSSIGHKVRAANDHAEVTGYLTGVNVFRKVEATEVTYTGRTREISKTVVELTIGGKHLVELEPMDSVAVFQ